MLSLNIYLVTFVLYFYILPYNKIHSATNTDWTSGIQSSAAKKKT